MKLITAMDEGELRTFDIETWAKKRNMPMKTIRQRLRSDYSQDEAVNLPRYEQPEYRKRHSSKFARRHDTDMSSKADKMWLRFITGGLRPTT